MGLVRLSLWLLCLVCVSSCRHPDVSTGKVSQHYDSVLQAGATLALTDVDAAQKMVLDASNAIAGASPADKYYKQLFLTRFEHDRTIVLARLDTMLALTKGSLQQPAYANMYGYAMLLRAENLLQNKDYEEALDCLHEGKKVLTDSCLLRQYYFTLFGVCYRQGRYSEAAHYQQQGLRLMGMCGYDYEHYREKQAKLNDLGMCYSKMGRNDSALLYFDSVINFLKTGADSFVQYPGNSKFIDVVTGIICSNKGDVLLRQGDTAAAIASYKQGAWVNGREGYDHGDAQCTQLKLADIFLSQHRLKDAAQMLAVVRASLDSFESREWRMKWMRLQMQYLHQLGNDREAFALFMPYQHLCDSIRKLERESRGNIATEYDRIVRIEKLEHRDNIKTIALIGAAVSLVLMLVLMIMLARVSRQQRRLNKRILKQNSELKSAMNALTESQKENTRMMQIVAHDLKNPIASMMSVSDILLMNEALEGDDRKMLELMKETSLHASEMISDLLSMDNARQIKSEPIELHLLLGYCVDMLQYRATEKQQKLVLDAAPMEIKADREKLWRVFTNLIVNAIKFSAAGSVVRIAAVRTAHVVTISVADAGIGIPDKLKPMMFEMFTQARRKGTSGEASSGLGLAISKRIVDAHNGRIWFDSAEGKGTTFYVELPVDGPVVSADK